MSKVNINLFNKAYISVVLAFILAIAAYDVSYSKSEATKETTANQQVNTKESVDSTSSSSDDEAKRMEARKAELAKNTTTPVATNATSEEEADQMATFSADYAEDIQTYTVQDIATIVADQLEIDESAALDQLIADLPKNVDLTTSQYQVVNKLNPLVAEPTFQPAYTANGLLYNGAIQDAYWGLLDGASAAGYTLATISAHRTIAYQEQNVQRGYNTYLGQGYSEAEASELTNAYYAPAQASEHSTGLAFDWLGTEWTSIGGSLDEPYADQPSAQWLADNAQDYGFILRYPKGKELVTGYNFEPWHYRYVGVEAAQYIHQYDLTLEEFYALVEYQLVLTEEGLA